MTDDYADDPAIGDAYLEDDTDHVEDEERWAMTVKFFARTVDMGKCEDYAREICDDRTVHVVVVEIFDHPSTAYSSALDAVTGPVVVGEADEVQAWLDKHGYTEYETQYELETYDETGDA